MKKDIEHTLIVFISCIMLVSLLLYSLKHSNDDREKEEQRRSEMTKTIGDEKQ